MVNVNVTEKTYNFTYFDIKQFFEILNKFIVNNGVGIDISVAALKTIAVLEPIYREVVNGIYVPEKDEKVIEYQKGVREIAVKYADRNEQGELRVDDKNNPIITEQIVEFQKELGEYNEKNKSVIEMANNAPKYNQEYLANKKDVTIFTLNNIDLCPNEVPPILVYYFFRDQF